MMQLCKLHKHALELEQSGGRRGRAEAEGVRGSQRWVEKGKGGRTMTRSLRRRGKQVREILESSILPADSGILNAAALMKCCTGMYLTCSRRLWGSYQTSTTPN